MADGVPLESGWQRIRTSGLDVLERALDSSLASGRARRGADESTLSHAQWVALYDVAYKLMQEPKGHSAAVYERHGAAINRYLSRTVFPALVHKRGDALLVELVARWELHKLYNRWCFKLFMYLDRQYCMANKKPSVQVRAMHPPNGGPFGLTPPGRLQWLVPCVARKPRTRGAAPSPCPPYPHCH